MWQFGVGRAQLRQIHIRCAFSALAGFLSVCPITSWTVPIRGVTLRGLDVKKAALALALVVASLSLGGCFVGKGKAPPPPVVTKG
jgi:hypothetical protein